MAEERPLPEADSHLQQTMRDAAHAFEDAKKQHIDALMVLAVAETVGGKTLTRAKLAMLREELNVAKAEQRLNVAELAVAVDVHQKTLSEVAIAQDAQVQLEQLVAQHAHELAEANAGVERAMAEKTAAEEDLTKALGDVARVMPPPQYEM